VERAVQHAAGRACRLQIAGLGRPGLSPALLAQSIESQVRAIVERLRRENVADYLDLPEGVRVSNARRLDRSPSLPLQLFRNGNGRWPRGQRRDGGDGGAGSDVRPARG